MAWMKFNLQNISIKTLSYFAFGVLAIISLAHLLAIRIVNSTVVSEVRALELANELTETTYAMVVLSSKALAASWPERLELKNIVSRHQIQLSTLEFGGKFNNDQVNAVSGEALISLKKSKMQWLPLQANISVLLDGEIAVDSLYLNSLGGPMASNTEGALQLITNQSKNYLLSLSELEESIKLELKRVQAQLNNIGLLFFTLEILLLVGIVVGLLKYIVDPLRKLSGLTGKLVQEEQIGVSTKAFDNEVGAIQTGLNDLTHKLNEITDFVKEIGNGNLEANLGNTEQNLTSDGLEAALISMRDEMRQVQKDEAQRKWATEGLAQFVEILRATDSDVKELGDKIISKLVDYTNSNQGGIYLLSNKEDAEVLELIALYAFSNKKYEERTIRIGEGLVGQTFLERKTTYLLEIPDDYIDIVSGLGGANPKAILIVPLMVNEDIYGILEIASFQEYEQHEINFIEKLCESIASTISGVKTNQQTKVLLEESQQLTEQMQAQEEEMRQNMEELTATQEEMARSEKERFAQQTAIDQNIGIAEFNSAGDIVYSNDEYHRQMGLTKERIQKMNMLSLIGKIIQHEHKGFVQKDGGAHPVQTYSLFSPIEIEGERKMVELSLSGDGIHANKADTDDLEKMLRQQLQALDITQNKLDEHRAAYVGKVKALTNFTCFLILNDQLKIKNINQSAANSLLKDQQDIIGLGVSEVFKTFPKVNGRQYLETHSGRTLDANIFIADLEDESEYLVHWN